MRVRLLKLVEDFQDERQAGTAPVLLLQHCHRSVPLLIGQDVGVGVFIDLPQKETYFRDMVEFEVLLPRVFANLSKQIKTIGMEGFDFHIIRRALNELVQSRLKFSRGGA